MSAPTRTGTSVRQPCPIASEKSPLVGPRRHLDQRQETLTRSRLPRILRRRPHPTPPPTSARGSTAAAASPSAGLVNASQVAHCGDWYASNPPTSPTPPQRHHRPRRHHQCQRGHPHRGGTPVRRGRLHDGRHQLTNHHLEFGHGLRRPILDGVPDRVDRLTVPRVRVGRSPCPPCPILQHIPANARLRTPTDSRPSMLVNHQKRG